MTKQELCKRYKINLNPLRVLAGSLIVTSNRPVTLKIHNGLYFQPLSNKYLGNQKQGGK